MLRQTFIHVPGLGVTTERELWNQGCIDWGHFLNDPSVYSMNSQVKSVAEGVIEKSEEALSTGHHQFFRNGLGGREAWRAWPEFPDSTVYLDIETDGGQHGDSITTIGMYDGKEFTCLVKGEDLGNFPDVISQYSLIVTFFGTGFDIPMLRKAFPKVEFDQIHMDLCLHLKRCGYRGGLKRIEKQLGIARSDETEGLDGRDAIRLWNRHLRGDDSALETLIEYNKEDVVNLKTLSQIAFDELQALTYREAGLTGSHFEKVPRIT